MKNKVASGYIGIKPSQNFLGSSGSEIFATLYKEMDVSFTYESID
jgi:hypothetical protein